VRARAASAAALFALAAGTSALAAPTPAPSAGNVQLQTPAYHIETDQTNWNQLTGDFTMPHKVTFSRPGTDATADSAKGNSKKQTVTLVGNVVVHDNGSAPEARSEEAYRGNGPATLTCDQLDVDGQAKIYTAIGHVRFEQKDETGIAERAVLNRTTGQLTLEGNVKLTQGPSTMTANVVSYNLNTKDVQVTGAPMTIIQPVPSSAPGASRPSPAPKRRR
jgi:lipopolysaccharide export system protein LptA